MTTTEQWKPISGYEGVYSVSTHGRVRNDRSQCILSPRIRKDGYSRAGLWVDGIGSDRFVHRLVAEAFLPNPERAPVVNHIDSNPSNNHVSNLEWTSVLGNARHAAAQPQYPRGERRAWAKLTPGAVCAIRTANAAGVSQYALAEQYGVGQSTISKIVLRKKWKHI